MVNDNSKISAKELESLEAKEEKALKNLDKKREDLTKKETALEKAKESLKKAEIDYKIACANKMLGLMSVFTDEERLDIVESAKMQISSNGGVDTNDQVKETP